jgi:single-stranded DNA-binding protein
MMTFLSGNGWGLAGDKAHEDAKGDLAYTRCSVAIHRKEKGVNVTDWYTLVAFGEYTRRDLATAEKGDEVSFSGRVTQRKDEEGNVKGVTVIVDNVCVTQRKPQPEKVVPGEEDDSGVPF